MRITKHDMEVHIYNSGNWCIVWRKNNMRHREDGPANIWKYVKSYRLKGSSYSKEDYWKKVRENY